MKNYCWMYWFMAMGFSAISVPALAGPPIGSITPFTSNLANGPCSSPEGIALDPSGNFYTASDRDGDIVGTVCVFNGAGRFTRSISVPAGPAGVVALLGLLFEGSRTLFALDLADGAGTSGRLLSIDTRTSAVTSLTSGFSFPNAIAEDSQENLYVSDSVQGTITRIAQDGSHKTLWSTSSLLLANPDNVPPLGANGVAFDRNFHNLYVANTGNDQIIRIPVLANGDAGTAQVFASGDSTGALNGPDGIAFDIDGNLYVACNQQNEIQVVSPAGRVAARYASPIVDFPASLIFRGNQLFFTNASLFDGGVNSQILVLRAARPGAPLE